MSAKLLHQIATGTNGFVDVEGFDAARTSGEHAIVQRKNDGGFVELLYHAGGHDADNAFRPAFALQNHRVFVKQAFTFFHHIDGVAGDVCIEFFSFVVALGKDFGIFLCGVIIFFDEHFYRGGGI